MLPSSPTCCRELHRSRRFAADTMPESFTSLVPAEQHARLHPAEAFPVTSVVYSEKDRVLLLTAQHFKTSTVVRGIPMGDSPLQASVALWWAVLTSQILRGELNALRDHCCKYHWATFKDLFDNFLDQVAALSHARPNDLIHAACQHCAFWEDTFLAKLQFDEFVEVLAGTRKAQPVLLRVPLLHWLTVWAATGALWPARKSRAKTPRAGRSARYRAPAGSANESGSWSFNGEWTISPCSRQMPSWRCGPRRLQAVRHHRRGCPCLMRCHSGGCPGGAPAF